MLHPIRSDSLTARHGFFDRRGGVSVGVYDSLNAGIGSSDDRAAVLENRRRIAETLGARHLVTVHQVHSPTVVVVDGPFAGDLPKADAMVTTTSGLALGALAADCAPVLFEDREAGVIGAAHAGWKGALGGVLDATVATMCAHGGHPGRIRAVVGPAISQRGYEVGPEFVERFLDADPDTARFFANGQGDRAMFDLPGYCVMRLRTVGVTAEWTGHCTFSDPARFYSYRRSCHRGEPDYGRLVGAIVL